MIEGFREKASFSCDTCRNYKVNARAFTFKLIITKKTLEVCQKCAERESGKKHIKRLTNG
jgi:hypothetical protein